MARGTSENRGLSYRARKRLALVVLAIGIPLYIVVAVNLVAFMEARWGRPSILVELALYIGLGVLWALPLKRVFKGIGQKEPEA